MPTLCRPAPARLHAGGDPHLLRAHRRRQARQHGRRRHARARGARGPQPNGAARHGGAAPAAGRHRELPRGPGRGARRGQQPRGRRRPARARCRSRACSTSSATTSARTRRRSSSASPRGARCGCATPTSSPASSVVKDGSGEVVELRCTYDPATRGGDRAGRPQGEGHHPLGLGGARRRRRGAAVRPALPDREPRRRGGPRLQGRPEPRLARGPDRGQGGAEPGRRGAGKPLPVRAPGLLLRRLARLATPTGWCSTAPSACATRGRRSRRRKRRDRACPTIRPTAPPGCSLLSCWRVAGQQRPTRRLRQRSTSLTPLAETDA